MRCEEGCDGGLPRISRYQFKVQVQKFKRQPVDPSTLIWVLSSAARRRAGVGKRDGWGWGGEAEAVGKGGGRVQAVDAGPATPDLMREVAAVGCFEVAWTAAALVGSAQVGSAQVPHNKVGGACMQWAV